ncbi:MAG: hypothetical protein WCR20_08520, partial [Verrucomicrobiota bacterium]
MEFFNSKTIEEIATHAEWIESMEQAMLKSLTSEIVLPKRMHLDHGNDTFLLLITCLLILILERTRMVG